RIRIINPLQLLCSAGFLLLTIKFRLNSITMPGVLIREFSLITMAVMALLSFFLMRLSHRRRAVLVVHWDMPNATMVTPALSVAGWGLHWMSMVIFPIPPRGVLVGQDSVKTVLRCGGLVMVIRVTDILLILPLMTRWMLIRDFLIRIQRLVRVTATALLLMPVFLVW